MALSSFRFSRTTRWSLFLALGFLAVGCRSRAPQGLAPGPAGPPLQGIALRGTLSGGSTVDLADGSRWAIQPAGQSATLRWRGGEPIQVVRSGHGTYPFILTNAATRTSALGRLNR
jgi:ferric-dicitrate binding protein FerR (iron transport regulator)